MAATVSSIGTRGSALHRYVSRNIQHPLLKFHGDWPVEIPEFDVVRAQPLQGGVECLYSILGRTVDSPWTGHDAELGRKEDLVALSGALEPARRI